MATSLSQASISVVVPCFNAAAYVGAALRSVAAQTRQVDEVILVDDGSTDDSAGIAREAFPGLTVIRQDNAGESAARNRGIAEARGMWIAFLDADDIWEPDKIRRQVEHAKSPDVVCVYTDIYKFDTAGSREVVESLDDHESKDWRGWMLSRASVHPSSALVRRDVAAAVGFREGIKYGEDTIFFLEVREHGRFVRVPEPLTGYRTSPHQQTKAPGSLFHATVSKYRWFEAERCRFSPGEEAIALRTMAEHLELAFQRAYWARDVATARACRRFYREHLGTVPIEGDLTRRTLLPRWLLKLKDRVESA